MADKAYIRWGWLTAGIAFLVATVSLKILGPGTSDFYPVDSESMRPTLRMGEVVRIDSQAYREHFPQAGDVVALHFHHDSARFEIARIIGTPGNRISFAQGKLVVNGNPVQNMATGVARSDGSEFIEVEEQLGEHKFRVWYDRSARPLDLAQVILHEGEFFASPDNRDKCKDSRHLGPVHMDDIIGRVTEVHDSPEAGRRGNTVR